MVQCFAAYKTMNLMIPAELKKMKFKQKDLLKFIKAPIKNQKESSVTFVNAMRRNYGDVFLTEMNDDLTRNMETAQLVKPGKSLTFSAMSGTSLMIVEIDKFGQQYDKLTFVIPVKPETLYYEPKIFEQPYEHILYLPNEPCAREGRVCRCDGTIFYGT